MERALSGKTFKINKYLTSDQFCLYILSIWPKADLRIPRMDKRMILFWKNKNSCGGLGETAGKVHSAAQSRTEQSVTSESCYSGEDEEWRVSTTLVVEHSIASHLHTSRTGMETLLWKGVAFHNSALLFAIACCKPHVSLFTSSKKHKEVYFLTTGGFEWCYTPQKLWARAALRKPLIHRATDLVGQLQSSVSFYTGEVRGAFKNVCKKNMAVSICGWVNVCVYYFQTVEVCVCFLCTFCVHHF